MTDGEAVLTPGLAGRVAAGVAGGLVGGAGFGVLMQLTDTIPVVASLVGRESLLVGWGVHLSIAMFVGVTYALIFGLFAVGLPVPTLLGSFYGLVWWFLGGLTLMPLRLGMGLFVFDTAAWQSLAGHLVYGLLLGVTYAVVSQLLIPDRGRHVARHPRDPARSGSTAPDTPEPPPAPPGTTRPDLPRRPGPAPLPPHARELRERQYGQP